MANRNGPQLVNLLDELYELIDDFLIVGIVLTLIFAVLTAFFITRAFNALPADNGSVITQILAPVYYLRWAAVLASGIPMVMFFTKTYQSWVKFR